MGNNYNVDDSCKILKALNKILSEIDDCPSEKEMLKMDDVIVLDPANVMGIIAKTNRAKKLIRRFVLKDENPRKAPSLEYHKQEVGKCRLSTEYMVQAINLFKVISTLKGDDAEEESFNIISAKNFPITMSNKDWAIILAPRIEND